MKSVISVFILAMTFMFPVFSQEVKEFSFTPGEPAPRLEMMMNYNTIVELPKDCLIQAWTMEKSEEWSITYDAHYIFVRPLKEKATGSMEIESTKGRILLDLCATPWKEGGDTRFKINWIDPPPPPPLTEEIKISKELKIYTPEEAVKKTEAVKAQAAPWVNLAVAETVNPEDKAGSRQGKKEKKEKKKSEEKESLLATDVLLSAMGGNFYAGKKSRMAVTGELIYAMKYKPMGIFAQAAAKVNYNPWITEIAASLGAGLEHQYVGFYVFGDFASYQIDEYQSTLHFQMRPAIRVKMPKFSLAAYYAIGVGEGTTIEQVTENGQVYDLKNDSLNYFGFECAGNLLKRLNVRMSGIFAEKKYYRIGADVDLNVWKSFDLNLRLLKSSFGEFPILGDITFPDSFQISAGISWRTGDGSAKFTDLSTRLIFKPAYPIVAQRKVIPQEKAGGNLYITLNADPTEGYAPLPVVFTTAFGGGKEPYTVELFPMWKVENNTVPANNVQPQYIYPQPGSFIAKAFITDSTGAKAESNEVRIVVKKSDSPMWSITILAGNGGTVQPGNTQVKDGEDSPVFRIQANSGYVIDYVLIDGKNEGALGEYQFKNVKTNHSLEAFFRTSGGNNDKFTIDSSAGTGLAIDPSGSRQYDKGSSAIYRVTITNSDYAIDQVIVDGSVVATQPPAPYQYEFHDIQANHTINVTSRKSSYIITASAGANGTITPSGSVTVPRGGNQSFTISGNTGYTIDQVLVDGAVVLNSPGPSYVYPFSDVQSDHTIHATFKVRTYTISVDHSGGGSTTPGYGVYTVQHGQSFAITATPEPGYEGESLFIDGQLRNFEGWYQFSNVQANHTYYAKFKTEAQQWEIKIDDVYYNKWGDPLGGSSKFEYRMDGEYFGMYFEPEKEVSGILTKLYTVTLNGYSQPLDSNGGCWIHIYNIHENHYIRASYQEQN